LGKKQSLIKQKEAREIADKLEKDSSVQTSIRTGRGHDIVTVRRDTELLATFGIRRSKSEGHGYIPKSMHLSERQTLDFARCSITVTEWLNVYHKRSQSHA
jgi:hypothetical protein